MNKKIGLSLVLVNMVILAIVFGSTDAGQDSITSNPQLPYSYLSFNADESSISGKPKSVLNHKDERILFANVNSAKVLSHKINKGTDEDNVKDSKNSSNFYLASVTTSDHRIKASDIENKSQSLTMPNALWLYLIGFILFFCARSPQTNPSTHERRIDALKIIFPNNRF